MAHISGRRALAAGALVFAIALARGRPAAATRRSNDRRPVVGRRRAAAAKIALLLPETKTARYETQDKPLFEAKVKAALLATARSSTATPTRTPPSSSRRPRRRSPTAPRCSCSTRSTRRRPPPSPTRPSSRTCRSSPTTGSSRTRRHRLLHLVRQRAGRQAAGPGARRQAQGRRQGRGTIVMINGSPTDNNAGLFKTGRAQRHRRRAASPSPPSTTRPTGARTRPRARWTRPSPSSARTGSSASTPPTTAPPAAPSPP